MSALLYDFERDGHIKEDEAIIVYVDGTTERVKASKIFKGDKSGEQRQQSAKRRYFGSRPPGTAKRRKAHTRQAPPGKRVPLRKA